MASPVNCASSQLVGAGSFRNETWTHSAICSFDCFAAFGAVVSVAAGEKAVGTIVYEPFVAAPSARRTVGVHDASHSPSNSPWGRLVIMVDPLPSAAACSRP